MNAGLMTVSVVVATALGVAPAILDARNGTSGDSQPELETIMYPGSLETTAFGINSRGHVVGTYRDTAGMHGFLLEDGEYASIDYPAAISTGVWGVNDAGDLVGQFTDAAGRRDGFVLRNGAFTTFSVNVAGATGTFGFGITPSGMVVGEYKTGQAIGTAGHAFELRHGSFTTIDPPRSVGAIAWAVNAQGDAVGYYNETGTLATIGWLRDRHGRYEDITYPGAPFTNARGINGAGTIVGLYRDGANRTHGFVRQGGDYTPFDVPGATATRLLGINDPGDMVGDYVAGGRRYGFALRR